MDDSEFWKIIELLNWNDAGDDEVVVEPVIEYLSRLSNEAIFDFEELLAQKLHALDTRSHAKEIGEYAYVNGDDDFSVDGFLYARCVVVVNGKQQFEQVLSTPTEFPKDLEFEAILYVAQDAYERKNGKEWDFVSPTDYETFKNISGWQ